jgi:hypothetical protein
MNLQEGAENFYAQQRKKPNYRILQIFFPSFDKKNCMKEIQNPQNDNGTYRVCERGDSE